MDIEKIINIIQDYTNEYVEYHIISSNPILGPIMDGEVDSMLPEGLDGLDPYSSFTQWVKQQNINPNMPEDILELNYRLYVKKQTENDVEQVWLSEQESIFNMLFDEHDENSYEFIISPGSSDGTTLQMIFPKGNSFSDFNEMMKSLFGDYAIIFTIDPMTCDLMPFCKLYSENVYEANIMFNKGHICEECGGFYSITESNINYCCSLVAPAVIKI